MKNWTTKEKILAVVFIILAVLTLWLFNDIMKATNTAEPFNLKPFNWRTYKEVK